MANIINLRPRRRRWHPSLVRTIDEPTTIEAMWKADFELREGQHVDVTTSGMWKLAPVVDAGLRSSLPTFQLGEMGSGTHLIAAAEQVGDEDYVEALRLFVREEQEHARLLALVCQHLDIAMIQSHWTDGVFQTTRKLAGLRAEVLMLLVAELVALRYYRVLADGVGDHVLSRIFERIQEDEQRHVEFHAATLPQHIDRWPTPVWWAARLIWGTALVGTSAVVAWDHRRVLRACGTGVFRFFRDMIAIIREQEPRFFRRAPRSK